MPLVRRCTAVPAADAQGPRGGRPAAVLPLWRVRPHRVRLARWRRAAHVPGLPRLRGRAVKHRYTLVLEMETLDGEIAPMPEDIEANAMHGGLHNYYLAEIRCVRGPEPIAPARPGDGRSE